MYKNSTRIMPKDKDNKWKYSLNHLPRPNFMKINSLPLERIWSTDVSPPVISVSFCIKLGALFVGCCCWDGCVVDLLSTCCDCCNGCCAACCTEGVETGSWGLGGAVYFLARPSDLAAPLTSPVVPAKTPPTPSFFSMPPALPTWKQGNKAHPDTA